jgi:hypothetical protein
MTLFADRVYQHCYRDGALTEANAIARWRQLNEFVSDAIIAESARWGDARKIFGEPTRTRDETFLPEVERVVGMMTGNVEHFIKVLREEGYYPTIDPPALEGTRLVNPNGSGNVVYTVDGSDPRAFGGGVSGTAIELSGASTAVEDVANVRARVRGEREWSALATFDSKLQ